MPNAYRAKVGDNVSYLADVVVGPPRKEACWRVAKVTAVNSQTSLVLAIRNSNGSLSTLGTVLKKTSGTQTNVWRPY